MLLKPGVDISRLKPEIRKKLKATDDIINTVGESELVITSTHEGTHGAGSLHYADLAIDIRRPPNAATVCDQLKERLGVNYDVVLEDTHIHIEYDPET